MNKFLRVFRRFTTEMVLLLFVNGPSCSCTFKNTIYCRQAGHLFQANREFLTSICEFQHPHSSKKFFLCLAYDASVVAAIQNLAHNNRQQIAAVQAEISLLKTLMKSQPKEDGTSKSPVQYDQDSVENFVKLLTALQEEQMKLSANVTNVSNDMKDEFYRKQVRVHTSERLRMRVVLIKGHVLINSRQFKGNTPFIGCFSICFSSVPSSFSCNYMPCSGCSALHALNSN